MSKGIKLNLRQLMYIRDHVKSDNIDDIADHLKISVVSVYQFCYRNNLKFTRRKKEFREKRSAGNKSGKKYETRYRDMEAYPVEDAKPPIKRPPSEYSNSLSPYGVATALHNGNSF